MAFDQDNWVMTSAAAYDDAAPQEFSYKSTDTLATQQASAYFNSVLPLPSIGDNIYLYDSTTPDSTLVRVTAISPNVTTTNAAIGASQIVSAQMSPLLLKYASVAISAAEFNGMYAAPKLLVAAAGANTLIAFKQLHLLQTYGSAAFAAGGVAAVQYDSTANGAGVIASTTQAAANFQATASRSYVFNAGVVDPVFTTCVNKGLYLSNVTGAFTTGTGSTLVAHVWYAVIPSV